MIEDIGGVTSQLVRLALDVSALRQQVIANNIANRNTPGFASQRVSFEEYFDQNMINTVNSIHDNQLVNRLEDIEARLAQGDLINATENNGVEFDVEMAKLAENVLRYQALLEGLSKRGSVIKMAVSEGR